MHIVVDECVTDVTAEELRRIEGTQLTLISEISARARDEDVLQLALAEYALLVTVDKDFGELVVRYRLPTTGVLLCRTAQMPLRAEAELIRKTIQDHGEELLGTFSVLTPRNLRIRLIRT
jgi:predicted nuclease of predicted toxin-antitoxin system